MTFPSLPSAIRTIFRTAYAKLAGYELLVRGQEREARSITCLGCPFRDDEQCGVCGCLWRAKVALAPEECPKGYWKAVWTKRAQK